jgi:flagellar motor switch/type III secretory pathway protein FliN
MICQHARVRWTLIPTGTTTGYKISDRLPEELSYGYLGMQNHKPDVDAVELLVQVVVEERHITVGELEKLVPGAEVAADVRPGRAVKIALNGRILGAGVLVGLPDQRVGVRVTGWDV